MASNLCTKCGAAWNGETGKHPCAGGGKCDIPAAGELNKEKLKAAAALRALTQQPAPQILFPGDARPEGGGAFYGVSLGAPMTDEQRLERFIENGHDARLLSDRSIVVRLGNGRWYRVAGGDFRSPSLIECSEQPPEAGL